MSLLRDQIGQRLFPLHRLDRGASGVLAFALSSTAASLASRAFAERGVRKEYLAIARGWIEDELLIEYPLDDDDVARSPRVEAITTIIPLARAELAIAVGRYASARYTLVRALPITGRRHQIRRHLAHVRHPIIGDSVHGDGKHNRSMRERFGVGRLLLHAERIAIPTLAIDVRCAPTGSFADLSRELFRRQRDTSTDDDESARDGRSRAE